MLLQVTRQLLAIVQNMRLVRLPFTSMLGICINVLSFTVGLFFDPSLIKTDNTFLELLVVSDVLDHFKDISLKPIPLQLLHVKLVTTV